MSPGPSPAMSFILPEDMGLVFSASLSHKLHKPGALPLTIFIDNMEAFWGECIYLDSPPLSSLLYSSYRIYFDFSSLHYFEQDKASLYQLLAKYLCAEGPGCLTGAGMCP